MIEIFRIKWETASALARSGFVLGIMLIVVGLGVGSFLVMRDDFQVLFSDLNGRDAAAMIGELERMKVPYRLTDNGTSILVERDAVYKTRLKLMGKGLDLHGSVGLEIFNNADFGMTEFAQKVNYQRALQGELERTIMGFDEVKQARVHLVLPEAGLFKRQNAKSKASISLVMKGDRQLDPVQVSGIQRLVAASVPEIEASAVTIVDRRGMAISKAVTGDEIDGALPARLQTKTQIEDYLTRKVVGVLDRAVGPGKAIVSIDATLNYDQVKVTKEDVVPLSNVSGQAVGAITRKRETQQGGDPLADLAAIGNTTARANGNAATGSSSAEIEFVNGRRVEQVVSAPGGVLRLSIGVLVPDIADPAELAKLREVVAMAAGINAARGDAIAVYSINSPGKHSGQDELASTTTVDSSAVTTEVTAPKPSYPQVTSTLLALLALAVLSTLAVLAMRRRTRTNSVSTLRLSQEARTKLLTDISRWAETQRV